MHRGDKNVHWGWDDTHRKSTGISGQGWEQGLHPVLLLLSPPREAGRCFVELQEQSLPLPLSPEGRGAQAEGTGPTEKLPATQGISAGPGPPGSHRASDHLGSVSVTAKERRLH